MGDEVYRSLVGNDGFPDLVSGLPCGCRWECSIECFQHYYKNLLNPEQRGKDLSPAEMDEAGAVLSTYKVTKIG